MGVEHTPSSRMDRDTVSDMAQASWQRVPTTANWMLIDANGKILRQIVVRDPWFGEPDGTKYHVSGDGHEESIHSSLGGAKTAAEASLP
jgi:hypothetical protein